MSHVSHKEFGTIKWLSIKENYNQCINSIAFKYFDNQGPHYLNEIFMKAQEPSSFVKLAQVRMPFLSLVRDCGTKSLKKSKE